MYCAFLDAINLPTVTAELMLIITSRKRSLGQGNILHLSVILFTGGVPGQVPPGQVHPPWQVHPDPPGRYTPWAGTPWQVHPPDGYTLPPQGRYNPPGQVHPLAGTHPLVRYTLLGRYPPDRRLHPPTLGQVQPPWAGTPSLAGTPRSPRQIHPLVSTPLTGTPPGRYTPWQVHPL